MKPTMRSAMKTVTRDEWNQFHKDHNITHEEIEINEGHQTSLVRLMRDNQVLGQAFYQKWVEPIYQIPDHE